MANSSSTIDAIKNNRTTLSQLASMEPADLSRAYQSFLKRQLEPKSEVAQNEQEPSKRSRI